MKHAFDHKIDALEAGYRSVNRERDTDISGPGSFGYAFRNPDGEETVDVYLRKGKNKGGGVGAVVPMYPPKEKGDHVESRNQPESG